jgi:hypothetical protein
MCPFLTVDHNLDPWIQFFKTLLDRPIPDNLESFVEDMDEIERRDNHIIWKIKGIAAKTTYRILSKYGNPKFVDEQFESFSKRFNNDFAVPLLESHL